MDRIELTLVDTPNDGPGVDVAITLNGRDLREYMRDIEGPQPDLERTTTDGQVWGRLWSGHLREGLRQHFTTPSALPEFDAASDKVVLLVCWGCRIADCCYVAAHVTVDDTTVTWTEFESRREDDYGDLSFAFERAQYEQVLMAADAELTRLLEACGSS